MAKKKRVLEVGEFAIPLHFQNKVLNMEIRRWKAANWGFQGGVTSIVLDFFFLSCFFFFVVG